MLFLCYSFVFVFILWAFNIFAYTPDQSPQHSHISSDFDWNAYLDNDMNETTEITSPLTSSTTAQDDQTKRQKNTPQSNIPKKAKKSERKRIYSEKQLAHKKEYQKQWWIEKKKKLNSLPQSKQDAIKEADKLRKKLSRAKQKELTGHTTKAKKIYAELRELIVNGKATIAQEIQWQKLKEKARRTRKGKTDIRKTL